MMATVLSLILLAMSGFRQLTLTRFQKGPWIVMAPLGNRPDDAGLGTGIDGRHYGPLTFASNGAITVVSDTYHQRLLFFRRGRVTRVPLNGTMIEDIVMDGAGHVLAADNRSLTLWSIAAHGIRRIMQMPHQPGYSEALWHVGVSADRNILVDWVKVGHGTFLTELNEYTPQGRFIRSVASTEIGQPLPQPLAQGTMAAPIRSFQVAPNGNIYVQLDQASLRRRVIRIYRPDGLFIGRVTVRSSEPINRADFLGVSDNGWLYLAVNINVPNKSQVLVVDRQGKMIADIHVATVPLYAATYGCVLKSGALYLNQSTASSYRIREYQPVRYRVWRWMGF